MFHLALFIVTLRLCRVKPFEVVPVSRTVQSLRMRAQRRRHDAQKDHEEAS
jgi:hypothetical protein